MIEKFETAGGTVRVSGELDAEDDTLLREALEAALAERPEKLVVDLSAVERIHSRPIAILCYAWVEALKNQIEMEVVASAGVERVFRSANLDQVFTLRGP